VGASRATSEWIGLPLRRAGIPPGTLVAVVRRGGRDLVPNGSTVLESEDELTLLGDPEPIRAAARELHPTDARPAVTRG
jgi:Trk K+ transport system NAD-binding subunit